MFDLDWYRWYMKEDGDSSIRWMYRCDYGASLWPAAWCLWVLISNRRQSWPVPGLAYRSRNGTGAAGGPLWSSLRAWRNAGLAPVVNHLRDIKPKIARIIVSSSYRWRYRLHARYDLKWVDFYWACLFTIQGMLLFKQFLIWNVVSIAIVGNALLVTAF